MVLSIKTTVHLPTNEFRSKYIAKKIHGYCHIMLIVVAHILNIGNLKRPNRDQFWNGCFVTQINDPIFAFFFFGSAVSSSIRSILHLIELYLSNILNPRS